MRSGALRIDFLYCTLTIVSIASIMAALSDLDQFFTGFIKIDASDLNNLFHFSAASARGDERATTGKENGVSEPWHEAKGVQPNLDNSRRFAEQMMSKISTNRLRNWTFQEVTKAVLKDIHESQWHRQGDKSQKYAVLEVEKNQ